MRAKVLRHLFKHLPDHIPSAKAMDDLKGDVPKLPEHRLFVTRKITPFLAKAPGAA